MTNNNEYNEIVYISRENIKRSSTPEEIQMNKNFDRVVNFYSFDIHNKKNNRFLI